MTSGRILCVGISYLAGVACNRWVHGADIVISATLHIAFLTVWLSVLAIGNKP